MGPISDIATLLIQTLATLYLFIVILRFLLQLVRADFYNPISQLVVKATNPVLIPLRKWIPGLFGVDLAAVILAIVVAWGAIELNSFFLGQLQNPISAIVWAALGVVNLSANLIFFGLIVWIIASWVAPHSGHPALQIIHQLVDPLLSPIRQRMPSTGGIDLSALVLLLGLEIVDILITHTARYAGVNAVNAMIIPGIG